MSELKQIQAAVLADDVYALTKLSSIEQAIKLLNYEHGNVFTFSDNNLLKGVTGAAGQPVMPPIMQ